VEFSLGVALSYLVGSIPTAYLVGKIVGGIDIRTEGSGNVGATNVFRVMGKKWGIGVLLFDMLKGYLAVSGLPLLFSSAVLDFFLTRLVFGLAAISGHTWPLWLGFRGGKGVATSLGVILALAPEAAGASLLIWLLVFLWRRYVSLASLAMAASFPLWVLAFYRETDFIWILFPFGLGLSGFVFYTHRENLRRLREGKEKPLL